MTRPEKLAIATFALTVIRRNMWNNNTIAEMALTAIQDNEPVVATNVSQEVDPHALDKMIRDAEARAAAKRKKTPA